MTRTGALCALILGVGLLCAADRPEVTVEVNSFGQYIWRGMLVTGDPVLQTSTTAAWRGFHVNAFTNTDLTGVNQRRGKFSELDFDAGYDRSIEKATLSGGLIHYTFPNTGVDSTTELYGGAALALPLHPAVRAYVDVGSIDGAYVTFDVSHAVALPRPDRNVNWTAELSAGLGAGSAGYNRGYFGVSHATLVDFHPVLSTPLSFGKRFRITPRVGYAGLLDAALRHSATPKAHNFYFGVGLSFTL